MLCSLLLRFSIQVLQVTCAFKYLQPGAWVCPLWPALLIPTPVHCTSGTPCALLGCKIPFSMPSCRRVHKELDARARLLPRLRQECGACAVSCAHAGRVAGMCSAYRQGPCLQELAVELVRLQLTDPDWNEAWGPYWRSLPPEGALGGKEAFDLSVLDELQDDTMASYSTTRGSSRLFWPHVEAVRSKVCPRMCAAKHCMFHGTTCW